MSGRLYKVPFAQIPEWVLYSTGISDRAIRLFAVLDRHADKEGRAYPGRTRLGRLLECSPKSTDRALQELTDIGAVIIRPRYREDGSQAANDYWIWPANPDSEVDTGVTPPSHGRPPPLDNDDQGPSTPVTPHEREPVERKPRNDVSPIGETRPEAHDPIDALCEQLATAIEHHGGVRPKIAPSWRRDMRLLLERGPAGVDQPEPLAPERVARAIEFTFTHLAERGSDGFCWADQIQAPSGLRVKWIRLLQAAKKLREVKQGRGAAAVDRAVDRLNNGKSLLGIFPDEANQGGQA